MTPRLDWRSNHDPRSLRYGVADDLDWDAPLKPRSWRRGPVLDQGEEGMCVGMGVAGELGCSPVRVPGVDFALAEGIYREAQGIDEWPGEDYSGTSVLAGMKVAVARGYFSGYHWCLDIDQTARTVVQLGPVVIGVPWSSEMYSTDDRGVVKLGGSPVGGHCLVVTGFHPRHPWTGGPAFTWLNSWGTDYGIRGRAVIRKDDLAQLLAVTGECAVPHGRKLPDTPH